jgi:hypothetical protein
VHGVTHVIEDHSTTSSAHTTSSASGRPHRSRAATAAGIVFVVAVVVAFPLFLVRGHHQWFFLDEWDFLAGRQIGSAHDLFRPHNEHWSTLPIIVYRFLWQVAGLRTYVPYQIVIVALHLTAAVLLRRIMRRAGVGPWVATAAAGLFVLLGSGRQDIVWAFQIGFTGSLVCGLGHLILADHDGPPNRRDALGIGLGLLGLLCSGVGVTMTVIVGLAVFIRRGWRAALLHTAPLAAVFGVWYVAIGSDAYAKAHGTLPDTLRFGRAAFTNAFAKMGQLPGVGVALAILLVVGIVLAWSPLSVARFRRQAAAPLALLAGAAVFLLIAGYGRSAFGPLFARESRYVHLVAAMTLPAIAVAADAVVRRWPVALPVVLVLLLIGVPGNIAAIDPSGRDRITLGSPTFILTVPRSPFAPRVPRSVHPDPGGAEDVTIGWLLDGVRSGRVPRPEETTPDDEARATLGLVLEQTDDDVAARDCRAITEPVRVDVRTGDVFVLRSGTLAARVAGSDLGPTAARVLVPSGGRTIRVVGGPLKMTFGPSSARSVFAGSSAADRLVLCRGVA